MTVVDNEPRPLSLSKQALGYLKRRRAPRVDFEELRAKRLEETQRITDEFSAKVAELLAGPMKR